MEPCAGASGHASGKRDEAPGRRIALGGVMLRARRTVSKVGAQDQSVRRPLRPGWSSASGQQSHLAVA